MAEAINEGKALRDEDGEEKVPATQEEKDEVLDEAMNLDEIDVDEMEDKE